jgi:hypothetical protein
VTTPNPNQPGYRPDSSTERQLGDVGDGTQFGIDLYELYILGRVHYPELAGWYSDMATAADAVVGHLEGALDGALYRQAHQDIVNLHSELQFALYRGWEAYDATGPALVQIADDYLATDDDARATFNKLTADLRQNPEPTAEEEHERKALDEPARRADAPPKPPPPTSTGRPVDVPRGGGGPQR